MGWVVVTPKKIVHIFLFKMGFLTMIFGERKIPDELVQVFFVDKFDHRKGFEKLLQHNFQNSPISGGEGE